MRGLLILTCAGVSLSHGTNDGQKTIGLIMLTVIGLLPATYALNPEAARQIGALGENARAAAPLIERYGDDQKSFALQAAAQLAGAEPALRASTTGAAPSPRPAGVRPATYDTVSREDGGMGRPAIRSDVYRVVDQLRAVAMNPRASAADRAEALRLRARMRPAVEYAPWWVRVLSALCLGLGTMTGYRRVVRTLGERVGNAHLTPAQGASAELVGATLIATAGYTGLPVSTTHIITSGIAGTMIGSGAGLNRGMLTRIALAWAFTLPVTIAAAAGLFYALGR